MLDERADFNPITRTDRRRSSWNRTSDKLADDVQPDVPSQCDRIRRSPRLRADIVVNNLVGVAYTTGKISDSERWNPVAAARPCAGHLSPRFLAVLEAPREAVHNQSFNVGSSQENYQIREIADMVREVVPGCSVEYMEGGGPDPRCYKVNCDKLTAHIPNFKTEWTVRAVSRSSTRATCSNG
jgi:hypothetical protein